MRKAILCVMMALALTGVASALSTPMGGTFYWTTVGTDLKLAYLDVNSSWAPVSAATPLSTLTLAAQSAIGTGTDTWFNPATGQRDETALHSGYVFAAVRYDQVQDILSTNPDNTGARGRDILALDSTSGTPGLTLINGGWDVKAAVVGPPPIYYPNTSQGGQQGGGGIYSTLVVDSGFTPNGEAQGFYYLTTSDRGWVWGGSLDSNGQYTAHTVPAQATDYNGFQTEGGSVHGTGTNYARLNGNVTGVGAVTGVVGFRTGPSASRRTDLTYKLAGTGYQTVVSYDTNGYQSGVNFWDVGNFRGMLTTPQIGDTDNDGKLDAYYQSDVGQWSNDHWIHSEDTNGDGDFLDAFETDIGPNITRAQLVDLGPNWARTTELINLGTKWGNGNDKWGLAMWQYSGTAPAMTASLRIAFLDSNGNYDGTGMTMIDSVVYNSDGVFVSGDSTMAFLRNGSYTGLTFVPLVIPEPGTLLLVGTGVLGLAGLLRRRFLS